MPGFILLLIAGGCLFHSLYRDCQEDSKRVFIQVSLHSWQRSAREEGTTGRGCSARHHRHVAGRVARGKDDEGGRRATTRRFGLDVMPEPGGGNVIRQAAGHRQVADNMRQRVDAALAADTAAARTKTG